MQTNCTLSLSLFFSLCCLLLTLEIAQAQPIYYVKPAGAGTGTSWADASANLQSIINASQPGDQIWVAAGVYKPTSITTDRGASFSLKNGVSILGGFPATGDPILSDRNPASFTTVLSGDIDNDGTLVNNSYHVINNTGLNNTAVLDGFVITMGNANAAASADNRGGGLYLNGSSPSLLNCRIVGNNADNRGGGLFNTGGSNPTVVNSSLESNTATFGGAIYNENGSPNLISSSLMNNVASGNGGAIVNFNSSSLTVVNCSLSSNTSPVGGALVNGNSATTQVFNSVLWNNGGAASITRFSGSILLTNSLTEPTVTNYSNQGGNLTSTTTPFASSTSVALNACSPAINSGSPASQTAPTSPYSATALPQTDLAGNPRIVGGFVDMGAVEFQGTPNHPVAFTLSPALGSVVCAGGSVTVPVGLTGTVNGYQWYKDGSLIQSQTAATLSLPNTQIADAGSYSVVVTGACNSVTSIVFSLTVNALPSVSVSASSTLLTCAIPSLTLTAQTSATAFVWSDGGSTAQTLPVSQTGVYSVTVTDGNGCTAVSNSLSISQDVVIPTVSISASNTILTCANPSLTLTATSSATALRWSDNSTSLTLPVSTSGTYSVTATGTNGCTATTGPLRIGQDFSSLASLNLMASQPGFSCQVRSIGLTATSGASSYRFSGPGLNQSGPTNTATVSTSGVYSVTASTGVCSVTAKVSLTGTAGTPPNALLVGNGSLSCQTPTLSLTAVGGSFYQFSGPGIVSQTDGRERIVVGDYVIFRTPIPTIGTAVVSKPGTYTVLVSDEQGCTSMATLLVTGTECR